jgi:hypothetical protein
MNLPSLYITQEYFAIVLGGRIATVRALTFNMTHK